MCSSDLVWNDELDLPQAWPFDAHLLDAGWKRPRVEQVCPTGALKAEKLTDAARDAKCRSEGWRPLPGEAAVRPRVLYRGFDRLESRLVAGTVTGPIAGRDECLEGVVVRLVAADGLAREVRTDAFGDFRFDVARDAGAIRLRVEHPGFHAHDREIDPARAAPLALRLEAAAP